ncbi:MAG: ATP-binding cassette domain-containing protein [Clostridiales Family XIII bacterium]|nr:ATP-binding cassette domain-containing protein [Clostridiales Family XIII bacterium]
MATEGAPRETEPILSVNRLTVRYGTGCSDCENGIGLQKNRCPKCGTIWALRDAAFSLYQGEVLGVVGESGSGKSTMMKCICFDESPTLGEYTVHTGGGNAFQLSRQSQKQFRNERMGMVYQNPMLGLKMDYSVTSNIAENLIASNCKNVSHLRARVTELLEIVEISPFRMKEKPKYFSGGMQQRVQIAKAIANNPQILLLDEVTTGLDLSVQAKVLDVIKKIIREFNVAVILVSHDLAVIKMLADRTVVMLDGEIIERGLTDQVMEDPQHPYTQQLVHSLL